MQSNKKTKTSTTTTTSDSPPPSFLAEIIASNVDLLTEILLRLPIKSLIKFKSVSKHWLAIISNPRFAHLRSPSPVSAAGLFLKLPALEHTIPKYYFIDLSTTSCSSSSHSVQHPAVLGDGRPSGVRIMQSCNGLILCCTSHTREESKSYFVYNPTTNHYTKLPPQRSPVHGLGVTYGLTLAFDPSKSKHYKVICVKNPNADSRFCIDVYSSDTGPWRSSPSQAYFEADYFNTKFEQGFFWNGSVHWITMWSHYSVYYNVEEDKLGQMPMPPIPDHLEAAEWRWSYFGESRGHLHFADHLYEPGDRYVHVFELERDYSRWSVKYRVDLYEVRRAFPEMIGRHVVGDIYMRDYMLSLLCVVRCEAEEESYLVMNITGKILSYNFKSGTCRKVCDIEPSRGIVTEDDDESQDIVLETSEAYQHIDSLACV